LGELARVEPRRATVRFCNWLASTWELDMQDADDRELLKMEALLFNDSLFAVRVARVDWEVIARNVRRMHTTLVIHAKKRGRVQADEDLDAWVRALVAAVRAGALPHPPGANA
jgi:hypothetical protein